MVGPEKAELLMSRRFKMARFGRSKSTETLKRSAKRLGLRSTIELSLLAQFAGRAEEERSNSLVTDSVHHYKA